MVRGWVSVRVKGWIRDGIRVWIRVRFTFWLGELIRDCLISSGASAKLHVIPV